LDRRIRGSHSGGGRMNTPEDLVHDERTSFDATHIFMWKPARNC